MTPADGLNPAFFRGVRFYVDKTADTSARAFEVKSFPRRAGARVSDDNLGAREVTVDAYVPAWADGAAASESFRAEMMAPGLGLLSLPTALIPRAGCAKCEQTFEAARLGLLKFKLTFVVDDEDSGAPPLGVLSAGIAAAAARLMAAVPSIIAPAGASPYFADGVAAGLASASAQASAAMPGRTVPGGLEGLIAAARDLSMAGTVSAINTAERLSR